MVRSCGHSTTTGLHAVSVVKRVDVVYFSVILSDFLIFVVVFVTFFEFFCGFVVCGHVFCVYP